LELPPTVPPTTTIPQGGACEAVCELGGQKAKCETRMQWSVKNYFIAKYDACDSAQKMVTHQCPVCANCKVEHFGCVDPQILERKGKEVAILKKYDVESRFRFRGRQQTEAVAAGVFLFLAVLSAVVAFVGFSLSPRLLRRRANISARLVTDVSAQEGLLEVLAGE